MIFRVGPENFSFFVTQFINPLRVFAGPEYTQYDAIDWIPAYD